MLATERDEQVGAAASGGADRARQAFLLLQSGFVLTAIVAGADKSLNVLTEWSQYLWPVIPDVLGLSAQVVMSIVGGIEMLAGVIVAVSPRLGGYILTGWLVVIIVNLLLLGSFWDIALRDVGLAIGALSLARLAPPRRTRAGRAA